MIEIIVAFIKKLVFLFISTEETSTILQADDVHLHTEPDSSAKGRKNQDTLDYEKEYENEPFVNEEEEEENADHENMKMNMKMIHLSLMTMEALLMVT